MFRSDCRIVGAAGGDAGHNGRGEIMTMNTPQLSDAEYAVALAAGGAAAETEIRRKPFATSPNGMPSKSLRTAMLVS
jgi:hypothetical protein